MPELLDRSPRISVRLYKTIGRKTIDGQSAVSVRYENRAPYIDLTDFLGDGSSVITQKSVKEPAGAFSITFPDMAHQQSALTGMQFGSSHLETIYGLVEPMDVVEIRMWGGIGPAPAELPIKMRGFVSKVDRNTGVGENGAPTRSVVVSGQDYGKIWQTFQVVYLAAYTEGNALLTSFSLWELFGVNAQNTMKSSDFIREMVNKIINPHIAGFMPENTPMPKELKTADGISVAHGVVNKSYQDTQGSLYDTMKFHGDVGIFNELYTEDREDGVHVVYRPIPAMHITAPKGATTRKIQSDAPDPIYVEIEDSAVKQLQVSRTDANVANFYWVNNSRFDLIDDMQRRLSALQSGDQTVNLKEYPNSAVRYYGVRMMQGETQQGPDGTTNMLGTFDRDELDRRGLAGEEWIHRRRRIMVEQNKDNVVLEHGSAKIMGGLMRPDGSGHLRAGDYGRFRIGTTSWEAYVTAITDEYLPYQGYTATITLERGEGFVRRAAGSSSSSPWIAEQAVRGSWE